MKKITYCLFLLIFTISLTSLEAQEKRQTTTQEQEIEAKLQTLFGLEKEVFERRVNISAQQQAPKALKMSSNSLQKSTEIQSSHVQSGFNLQGDLSCSQEQVSNNFENGLFIEAGGQKVADDFFVSINADTFDVNQISANILSQGGLESVNITFYEDDAGLPGTQIGASIISLVPTSQDVIGTAFGYDVHDVVLDLPSTISFAGTGTEAVRYWVQLEGNPNTAGTSVGIESTSVGVIGELSVFDNDGNATNEWLLNDGGLDSVITISGNCIQVSGCLAPENFVVSPTGENADFTWDNVPGAVDGYTLSVFEAGADPTTATAVFSANYGAGTTMATATGLSTTTPYDAYISSDCGGTISAQSTLSFSTTIEDPVCGNSYLDSGGRDNNYQDSELITTTIFPENDGDVVTLTFTFVDIEVNTTGAGTQDGCWDFLTIYNGPDTTSPVLAQTLCGEASGSGATPSVDTSNLEIGDSFTSTDMSGALTIVFTSDDVFNFGGFEAVISCDVPPVCIAPDLVLDNVTTDTAEFSWSEVANANNGYIFSVFNEGADPTTATPVYTENIPAGTLTATATGLSDTTIYDAYITADCDADGLSASDSVTFETNFPDPACDGTFSDSGGVDGNYSSSEVTTTTITPDNVGDAVTITFTYVDIETATAAGSQDGCWDFMTIYNGPDTTFPVLAQTLCGEESGDGGAPSVDTSLLSVGDAFTSTDPSGALTIVFTSDSSIEETGWLADVTCATLSVDEFSATNFTYYPNPSTGHLTINSKETIDSIEVINLLGQQLIKQKPNSQDYTLDLTTLSAGQYFLRAQIDGKTVVKSILKE
ncbi:T9SS type A sorting domain-containing protein [Croceibacter atlanticus]|uniref:T9SS type A sorting domain-containing protein n=1 Tax=Croceibacter atlanticus TaxID=313588 RepID=UPI0030F91580